MEKKKIDRIIQIIRENMVVGSGGFTNAADPKGPVAGFDPLIKSPMKRGKQYAKGGHGSRKRWLDYLKSYNGRRN
jgi:hypothetical protein